MGLFSSSSKASSLINTATDRSNVVTGTKNQVGTVNIGERANYLESGAFSNTGTIKSGLADSKITAGANSSITIGETGLGETFANTIKDLFAMRDETATATDSPTSPPSWMVLPGGNNFGDGGQGNGITVPDWLKSPWLPGALALAALGFLVLRKRA
jgi:hypothetical protein